MDGTWLALVSIFIAGILPTAQSGFTIADETRLRSDKLKSYAVDVRPTNPTIVRMSFQLTAISSLDIKNQQFSVAGWWSMHWTDSRLAWNRSNYNDIPVVQIYEDKIWTPTVVVDNSVDDLSAVDEDTIPLRINHLGIVAWNPPGLVTVNCDMDITHFPFDTQLCSLQITSFGYTIQELDLKVYEDGVNLKYYAGNGEWDMLDHWTERSTYTEGEHEFARVYYYFKLERKPMYYGLNMLLPVIVTALLIVFVFLLPAESGEKIGYCLTVMLAFMVILTLIAGDLPTTASNTSLLELYIAVVLIMGALSVILSIWVLNIYHRPDELPIPGYVQQLITLGIKINCCHIFTCFCSRRVKPEVTRHESVPNENRYQPQRNSLSYNNNHYISSNLRVGNRKSGNDHISPKGGESNASQKSKLSRQCSEFSMRPINNQSTAEDVSRGGEITWQTVSIVTDGILLRFYVVFLSVSSAVFITLLIAG